ncbi:LRR receptor-like serine/threonine-protein kinase ERL1 [Canna indica]|uniref:LRR receptor-like serine/threonine-protein kinase ERL1 n=1 Tax=Canna indica TaxID=4628 RepID=A0AAQ3K8I6_9LILI|nr:LRR receptor-like serine/threonine-protein kinase ERL1 [Canna indica]
MDMGLVKKAFQLALLCTKKHPSNWPTMHEVARLLVTLLPTPGGKHNTVTMKSKDYTHFLDVGSDVKGSAKQDSSSLSDAQWVWWVGLLSLGLCLLLDESRQELGRPRGKGGIDCE